jgi:hypothetical protein
MGKALVSAGLGVMLTLSAPAGAGKNLLRKALDRLRGAVQTVTGRARELVTEAPRIVGQVAEREERRLAGFADELQESLGLVRALLEVAGETARKLAELRAMRARPPPVDTRFDPAAALSAAGKRELWEKAEEYERMARERHLQGHLLITQAAIHPASRQLATYVGAIGDAAYHSGQALAAFAFKYGVTGAPADLASLKGALTGVYNLMTIAAAPAGRIVDPRTGQPVAARPGLPVRGYAEETAPLFQGNYDLRLDHPATYRYEGALAGLPAKAYLLRADVSASQIDGLLFGLAAAFEVLSRRRAEPEWRQAISAIVARFASEFVKHGYKVIDLNGAPTRFGDQSSLTDPVKQLQNLSWLTTALFVAPTAEMKRARDSLVRRIYRPLGLRVALFQALEQLLSPALRTGREVLGYVIKSYNYNALVLALYPLLRHAPDGHTRRLGLRFLEKLLWPLLADLRVPFFDFFRHAATGRRDELLLGRAAAVLRQYRRPPFPFGNPAGDGELVTDFSARAELHDPLYFYLREVWETKLKERFKGHENPIRYGGSAWPLGPGLVPQQNNIERAHPYELRGTEPRCGENLCEYPGSDYLLSYWFGRYHGLL